MRIIIVENYEEVSRKAAKMVSDRLRQKPDLVLGLATGSTPVGMYQQLIKDYKEKGLDFSKARSFNLDEYCGLLPDHLQSYHYFMWNNFFDHINIQPENVYIPKGEIENAEVFCNWYEQKIKEKGGIDLQVLGIGSDAHIGFNEPGSSLGSRTRIKILTEKTREDNSRFFGRKEDVPRCAITMGLATIFEAQECLLMANGDNKAEAIQRCIEGPVGAKNPASLLQLHPKVSIIIDEKAAKNLERKDYYKYTQKITEKLETR